MGSDDLLHGLSCLLLFLGCAWAFAALGSVGGDGSCIDWHVLYQARVVEVDQGRDGDVLLLDVVIVENGCDGLLDLG